MRVPVLQTVVAGLGRRQRLAHRAVAVVFVLPGFQLDVLVFRRRQRQAGRQAAVPDAVGTVHHVGFRALVRLAEQLQPQLLFLDGAGQVEIRLPAVAQFAVLLQRRAQVDRARPGLRHLARDDVDHPANRVGSIQRRHRPAHHFDPLDGGQGRNLAGLHHAQLFTVQHFARPLPLAVHQDQGVFARHAADGNVLLVGIGPDDADAFDVAQRILQGASAMDWS
ncbi:hypothetical protein G6F57_018422 [Rhizopus arrhizus]|nr:hypothetical protein G6F57_018422 [Rhizopus arrhizus]